MKGNKRNYVAKSKHPLEEAVMDLPDKNNKGAWTEKHSYRIEEAGNYTEECDSVAVKISEMKSLAKRNTFTLEVYEQVNNLVQFTNTSLLLLRDYDLAENQDKEKEALAKLRKLPEEFTNLRVEFEKVYGKSRILTKPNNYILDQDHHVHLANQSLNFDWQFLAEMKFLEKLEKEILK